MHAHRIIRSPRLPQWTEKFKFEIENVANSTQTTQNMWRMRCIKRAACRAVMRAGVESRAEMMSFLNMAPSRRCELSGIGWKFEVSTTCRYLGGELMWFGLTLNALRIETCATPTTNHHQLCGGTALGKNDKSKHVSTLSTANRIVNGS